MSLPVSADSPSPIISVIMAVYNGEACVNRAIHSILIQSFTDFEFIIVNDGSTDGTLSILNDYAARDSRVRIIDQENQGLTKSLNTGIKAARGKYLARQDADDVSYPNRFQKQIDILEGLSGVVLVGGCSDDVHEDGTRTLWPYHDDIAIQSIVFLKTPFPHSTAMMRRDICVDLGGYDEQFRTAQDMDLWMRLAKRGRISMVREPVLERSVGSGSISAKRRGRQFYDGLRARLMHGHNPALALYHSARSIIIALLPAPWIQKIKAQLT